MTLSPRAAGLRLSPIRAMTLEGPPDVVSLSLGEPGWPLHPVAREALAHPPERLGYGPNAGLAALREEIAAFHGAAPEQVRVTAGAQGALCALFQAYLAPGQVALVPDPGFPGYWGVAALAGADLRTYPLGLGGALDPAGVRDALASAGKVGLVVVNHPGNPTGGGAGAAALREVADTCREHGALLVSDEVYRELHLGERAPSLRDVDPDGVVVSSVSKGWGAPGLRVGWVVGPEALVTPVGLVHNAMTSAAATPSQLAALALLHASARVLAEARAELARRWEIVERVLGPRDAPAGGFCLWWPVPQSATDPLGWCLRLRDEARVSVVPGDAFGEAGRGFVRVSWGGDPEELETGLRRILEAGVAAP